MRQPCKGGMGRGLGGKLRKWEGGKNAVERAPRLTPKELLDVSVDDEGPGTKSGRGEVSMEHARSFCSVV